MLPSSRAASALTVEYAGQPVALPCHVRLRQRVAAPDGISCVAEVRDADGDLVASFAPSLEDRIQEDAEAAVLARAERVVGELVRAAEQGTLALKAQGTLTGGRVQPVLPKQPPPVLLDAPRRGAPVLDAALAPGPSATSRAVATSRVSGPVAPRPRLVEPDPEPPVPDYGMRWWEALLHPITLLFVLFAGGGTLAYTWARHLPLAERQLRSYSLEAATVASGEPGVSVLLRHTGFYGIPSSAPELERRLQGVARQCDVTIASRQPLWPGVESEWSQGPDLQRPPEALLVRVTVPEAVERARAAEGRPFNLLACAVATGQVAPPATPNLRAYVPPVVLDQELRQRVETLAEAEARYRRTHGTYADAQTLNAQSLATSDLEVGAVRSPDAERPAEVLSPPEGGVALWAWAPSQHRLCAGSFTPTPAGAVGTAPTGDAGAATRATSAAAARWALTCVTTR